MALVEELPPSVETTLRTERNGSGGDPLAVAVKADIGSDGNLGERWVVVDADTVRVLTPNGTRARVDVSVPLTEIRFAQTENLVGGGALAVGKGTDAIELVRYTTPLQARMGGVARTIEALAKNEEPPALELEDDERVCKNCGRPLSEKSDVCRACINRTAVLRRLFSYAAPFKWKTLVLLLLMFAGTGMALAPPLIQKNMIDRVLAPEGTLVSPEGARLTLLGLLIAALVGTQMLNVLLTVVRGRLSAWLSANVTFRIRTQLYERLQWLGLNYYDKRQTGALMTRVTQDVNELNHFLVDGLQYLVVNGLTIVGIATILLLYNARLTLLVLVPVPLVIWATRRAWRCLWRYLHRLWHLRSALSAGLNSALSVRVVKAFAQESREIDQFNQRATNSVSGRAVRRTVVGHPVPPAELPDDRRILRRSVRRRSAR